MTVDELTYELDKADREFKYKAANPGVSNTNKRNSNSVGQTDGGQLFDELKNNYFEKEIKPQVSKWRSSTETSGDAW